MKPQISRDFPVHLGQEFLELGRSVAAVQRADDLAGGDFESGKQGRGAGRSCGCGVRERRASSAEPAGIGPGLNLRLLVHTEPAPFPKTRSHVPSTDHILSRL